MASETNETREKSLNFLEEIIEESIAKGETRVQTRFCLLYTSDAADE